MAHSKSHPNTVEKIEESLYADDFSGGDLNDEKTIQLYHEGRKIFKEAGMNLRKWRSNSKAVMDVINEDEGVGEEKPGTDSYAELLLNPADRSPVKVLGHP